MALLGTDLDLVPLAGAGGNLCFMWAREREKGLDSFCLSRILARQPSCPPQNGPSSSEIPLSKTEGTMDGLVSPSPLKITWSLFFLCEDLQANCNKSMRERGEVFPKQVGRYPLHFERVLSRGRSGGRLALQKPNTVPLQPQGRLN